MMDYKDQMRRPITFGNDGKTTRRFNPYEMLQTSEQARAALRKADQKRERKAAKRLAQEASQRGEAA